MVEVALTRYERAAMLAVRWAEQFPAVLPLLSDLAGSGPIVLRDAADQAAMVDALFTAAAHFPPDWALSGPAPRCCSDPVPAADRLRFLAVRLDALAL